MSTGRTSKRGFKRTSALLQPSIRRASETRGFAVSRVLTHWTEIVGADIAEMALPVDVSFGRKGLGATLTLLTTGAQAPVLEMQKEKIRERVNAAYGYNAIARLRVTQTAPTGFSEGQVAFAHKAKPKADPVPDPAIENEVGQLTAPVGDTGLRTALENLGRNVLSNSKC